MMWPGLFLLENNKTVFVLFFFLTVNSQQKPDMADSLITSSELSCRSRQNKIGRSHKQIYKLYSRDIVLNNVNKYQVWFPYILTVNQLVKCICQVYPHTLGVNRQSSCHLEMTFYHIGKKLISHLF